MGKRDNMIKLRKQIFADRLRQALEEKGITQTTFAQMMGTTQQTVSRWCKGVCEPDYDSLILICGYLDETPNDLLEFDEKQAKRYAKSVIRDIAGNDKEFRKTQRELNERLEKKEISIEELQRIDQENYLVVEKKYIEMFNFNEK